MEALVPVVLVVALVGVVAWWVVRAREGRDVVCLACEHVGAARRATRGSLPIELVLWLLFIVPGLVYSLWRLSTRRDVCAMCGSEQVVPRDSPAGRRIVAAHSAPAGQAPSV